MSTSVPLGPALAEAFRSVRYARSVSQRGLARQLRVGKSTVNRLEQGETPGPLATLLRVLGELGFSLHLVDDRTEAQRQRADLPPEHQRDEEAEAIVDCWRTRVDDEAVRDAAGRRPPAHVHVYPIRVPHRWWFARHPRTPWVLRPLWSWSRWRSSARKARRLGRYPPPVGLPPWGGAPMQGFPP